MEKNIKIGIDSTDHFSMFCPECFKVLKIKEVQTLKIGKTKCTYLHCICDCGFLGFRKICWDGACCIFCKEGMPKKSEDWIKKNI